MQSKQPFMTVGTQRRKREKEPKTHGESETTLGCLSVPLMKSFRSDRNNERKRERNGTIIITTTTTIFLFDEKVFFCYFSSCCLGAFCEGMGFFSLSKTRLTSKA